MIAGLVSTAAAVFIFLQLMRFWHHFFPNKSIGKFLLNFYSFHIANPYGIFAL